MSKQRVSKEKCYVIICREIYYIDKVIGAFKEKEDAKCFIDLMNSKMSLEERLQRYYIMCETEMITDWRLENR